MYNDLIAHRVLWKRKMMSLKILPCWKNTYIFVYQIHMLWALELEKEAFKTNYFYISCCLYNFCSCRYFCYFSVSFPSQLKLRKHVWDIYFYSPFMIYIYFSKTVMPFLPTITIMYLQKQYSISYSFLIFSIYIK